MVQRPDEPLERGVRHDEPKPGPAGREDDRVVGGPGIAATDTQTKGSVGYALVAGLVGVVIGALIALLFFPGPLGVLVSAFVFGFAGATFGGVVGGFVSPRKRDAA